MSGNGHNAATGVVVLAASSGGLDAFGSVLAALPVEFPLPLLVVQHRSPAVDHLAAILAARGRLPVTVAAEGLAPRPGTVHVVPARGQTVLAPDGRFASFPAARCRADPLLASCADVHRDRTLAVILTGRLDDGALGVRTVKRRGGIVIVQEPGTAAASGMPAAAVATGCADHVLPLETIGPALVALAMAPGAADLFRVRLSPWAALAS